jgi:hypothetical protein
MSSRSLSAKMGVGMKHILVFIEVLDELGDAPIVMKLALLVAALILEADGQSFIQERHFAQALGQGIEVELDGFKNLPVRQESNLRALFFRLAGALDVGKRFSAFIRLFPGVAVAPDFELQRFGKGVYHRHTHAVQPAGDLVAFGIELAPRVQDGHHHFRGGAAFLLVHVHGNAAAIVRDRNRVIAMHNDGHEVAVTCQGFVHRVVNHFPNQMVQSDGPGGANVHRRPLPNRFQTAQNLDAIGIIGLSTVHLRFLLLAHVTGQPPDSIQG